MVYFSYHLYNRFVDSLSDLDMTDELRERIKANLCEITEYNPKRVRIEEHIDDPKERYRIQKQKYCEINREAIRERSKMYMRNKREAARLAQESKIVDVNFNGVVMV